MAEAQGNNVKDQVTRSPAAEHLKEELRNYLQARTEHAVSALGDRLSQRVSSLGEPGQGAGALTKGLAKGGEALSEGKSPARAALSAGASQLGETVKDKVKSVFGKAKGKGRPGGSGTSKRVVIVEDIDVGVPVREAYDQWTQFQEFSRFAKGVVSVEKTDDTTSNWKVKVAKSTRSLRANVTEQVPDQRITWTTEGAKGTVKGVVTFHPITDDLTRVLLVLEYFPKGLFEKTGNLWRAQGRRARLDLKLYRAFIMTRGEATDGWRGTVEDGEVVQSHEEAVEEEESQPRGGHEDPDERDARADADDSADDEDGDADSDPEDLDGGEQGEGAYKDEADDEYEDDEVGADPHAELEGEDADADADADDLADDEYGDEADPEDRDPQDVRESAGARR